MQSELLREIERLRAGQEALQAELRAVRLARQPLLDHPLDVRWAITTDDDSYPTGVANTFPIRFLDCYFATTAGVQALTYAARSTDAVTFARTHSTGWIPPDTPLPVFHQRGLNDADQGQWWLLDAPHRYYGKTTEELSPGESANVAIWLLQQGTWSASGAEVLAYDRFLKTSTTIAAHTWVGIHWYIDSFVVDVAKCEPEAS